MTNSEKLINYYITGYTSHKGWYYVAKQMYDRCNRDQSYELNDLVQDLYVSNLADKYLSYPSTIAILDKEWKLVKTSFNKFIHNRALGCLDKHNNRVKHTSNESQLSTEETPFSMDCLAGYDDGNFTSEDIKLTYEWRVVHDYLTNRLNTNVTAFENSIITLSENPDLSVRTVAEANEINYRTLYRVIDELHNQPILIDEQRKRARETNIAKAEELWSEENLRKDYNMQPNKGINPNYKVDTARCRTIKKGSPEYAEFEATRKSLKNSTDVYDWSQYVETEE